MKVGGQEGRCRCGAELQQRVAPCPDKRPGCGVLHKEDYCVRCEERPGAKVPFLSNDDRVDCRVMELESRLAQFERTFQEHGEYMQKLQGQVDKVEQRQRNWMDEANSRLGER